MSDCARLFGPALACRPGLEWYVHTLYTRQNDKRRVRRLRIFGQRDKLKADRSKGA